MFLYSLLAIGGVLIVGRAVSRTLFLSRLPESATPYKYILPPLFVMLTVAAYARLLPRRRLPTLAIGTNFIMIAAVLILRAGLETPYRDAFWLLAALFIAIEVIATLIGIQFWTFAGELFHAREARRLFGLIALGGTFANVVAGAGLRLTANWLRPADLLLLVAASLLGCAGCVLWLARRETAVTSPPRPAAMPTTSLTRSLRAIAGVPLLVSIGSLMLLSSLVTNIADYQLDLSLQRFFAGDGQSMLAFLGAFQLIAGMLAVLVQLFATGRVLERLGLIAGLLFLPLSIGLGSSALLVTGGVMWAAALPRGFDVTFRYTLNDAALNTLFLPVAVQLRRQAKALLDGVVKPPVVGLLGVLFLLLMRDDIDLVGVQAMDVLPWSAVVLGLIAVWLLVVRRVKGQYRAALESSLRRRRLMLDDPEIDFSDEDTMQVLGRALQSDDHGRILHVLHLMASAPEVDWGPWVLPLLQHNAPEIRTAVVDILARHGSPRYLPALQTLLDDPEPGVQAAAIMGTCRLAGSAALEPVRPYLDARRLEAREAAVVGLLRFGDDGCHRLALPQIERLLDSGDPAERAASMRMIGAARAVRFEPAVVNALSDPAPAVQRQAIAVAAQLGSPALVPLLIDKLGQPATAVTARDALASFGSLAEPALANLFNQDRTYPGRSQVPKVLGRIPDQGAVALLLAHLDDPDAHTRARTILALGRLQREHALPVDRVAIEAALAREMRNAYAITLVTADLGSETAGELLLDVLKQRRQYALDRIFYLLDMLHPRQLALVRSAVTSGDVRRRAAALELLEMVVARETLELLQPLLEASLPAALQVGASEFNLQRRSAPERLRELADDGAPYVRACTLFQIGRLRLAELWDCVEAGLTEMDPLVRETAVLASRALLPAAAFRDVLQAQIAGSAVPAVQRYARHLLEESE